MVAGEAVVLAADVEKERARVAELPEGEEKEAVVVRLREKEARAVVAGEAVVLGADVEKERTRVSELPEGEEEAVLGLGLGPGLELGQTSGARPAAGVDGYAAAVCSPGYGCVAARSPGEA